MRTFTCVCDNQLFFSNTVCVRCWRELGFCPVCQRVTALVTVEEQPELLQCGHADCGAPVVKCANYLQSGVCNGLVPSETPPQGHSPLCEQCQLTRVIPDLSVPGNREKWAQLELAKRRVLYALQLLDLPIGTPDNEIHPKLWFEFKADAEDRVFTGHDEGVITINVREADDVERELARVQFGEPQRTLVGHVRHELGHYYWDVLIRGQQEEAFRNLFGDERSPSYQEAQQRYYSQGPALDWPANFISAYASMHPWEDFAETFGAYLDMIGVLDTSGKIPPAQLHSAEISALIQEYQQVGILANELNREMGLKDLVPEVFGPAVMDKLAFVHALLCSPAEAVAESAPETAEVDD